MSLDPSSWNLADVERELLRYVGLLERATDATSRTIPAPLRVLRRVVIEDGCWVFVGAKTEGYGKVWVDQRRRARVAHRVVYEALVGPVPESLQLDHLCRKRACVNPAHLEPVTPRENTMRGNTPAALNARKQNCPAGHPYDVENTWRDAQGRRVCRECSREHTRRWRARQQEAC